jgi:hypothetical protein
MTEVQGQEAQEEATVPVSFRLSTYWKLPKGMTGVTHTDSRRVSLYEALNLLLRQLSEEEATVTAEGTSTVITIDWAKVPQEIQNPFAFGVRR